MVEPPLSGRGYSIRLNPKDDVMFIDLWDWKNKPFAAEIYALNKKVY